MRLLPVDPARIDPGALAPAVEALRTGGLVALPTETVYGLAAHANDPAAVARIFAAKGRPADNPLIVHLADAAHLGGVVRRVTPLAAALGRRFWPGPLTVVLDAAPHVPAVTTGGRSTVAVRVPGHPVALAVLAAAAVPVAAPSANRSGRPSPTTAAHVLADLADRVDVIVDAGPCPVGVESTVVDARGSEPVILREGAVAREDLGVASRAAAGNGASPGTRYRHYAPACRVEIAPAGAGWARAGALARAGARVGLVAAVPPGQTAPVAAAGDAAPGDGPGVRVVARFSDAAGLASRLYGALRAAEAAAVDVVVIEAVDEVGIGRAVMDRLRRAAAG